MMSTRFLDIFLVKVFLLWRKVCLHGLVVGSLRGANWGTLLLLSSKVSGLKGLSLLSSEVSGMVVLSL